MTESALNMHEFASLSAEEQRQVLLRLRDQRPSGQAAPAEPDDSAARVRHLLRQVITARPGGRLLPFPLTPIQESFLVAKQVDRKGDRVGCHVYLEIAEARLDVPRLERAFDRLVAHHDMLRTLIHANGTQQVREPGEPQHFQVDDLRGQPSSALDMHLERVRAGMSHRVYEPESWPLYEIRITHCRDERSLLHVSIDEWILDAAGINLLLTQWYRLYCAPHPTLPPCDVPFQVYVLFT